MAEKMFAHQISERGLAGVVRVHHQRRNRRMARRRRRRRTRQPVLRRHGYPTDHRAAQVGDDHLAAHLVVALGRNHLRMLGELGVEPGRLRMLRSFDPRSGAHALDVEDPYYGDITDFEETYTVIRGSPARPACMGRRTACRPRRTRRLMRRWRALFQPGWLALAVAVVAFAYLCFTVLAPWQLGKNTKTSRENNQIETSLNAAPIPVTEALPRQDSSAPDLQWRQVTATATTCPPRKSSPACEWWTANRPSRYSHHSQSTAVPQSWLTVGTSARTRGQSSAVRRAAGWHRQPHRATSRLRNRAARQSPFHQDGVLRVYAIDTRMVAATTHVPLAGSYLQLVEGQPGGLGLIALPHLDAGPFPLLRNPMDRIRHRSAPRTGLFRVLRNPRTPPRIGQQSGDTAAEPVTAEDKLADRYGRRR